MNNLTDLYRHPDYRDFLAAAALDPLDDGLRLALSDWLEEHGDIDRATFVRLQVERSRLHWRDPRSLMLSYDEDALLNHHRGAWLVEVPDWLRPYATFERGLVGAAHYLPVGLLVEHAGDDWSCLPLHRFHLKEGAGHLEALFDCPRLSQVTSIYLFEEVGAAAMKKLGACRRLVQLRELGLCCAEIGPREVRHLARRGSLDRLERLCLWGNPPLGGEGVEILAGSSLLGRLTHLDLYECGVTGDAVRALLDGPIDNLVSLGLGTESVRFGSEGIAALAGCARLRGLRELELDCQIGGDGDLLTLAASPHLGELREFRFGLAEGAGPSRPETVRALLRSELMRHVAQFSPWTGCPEGDDFARILAESETLDNVLHLDLGSAALTPAGLEALAHAPHLRSVIDLNLNDSQRLGDEGARLLADWPFAEGLVKLWLSKVGLSRRGAEYLAASPGLARLRELQIGDNPIGDGGFAAIAASPYLANLHKLFTTDCGAGPAGATALAKAPFLAKLLSLDLDGNHIGAAGAKVLFAAAMPCLEWLDLNRNEMGSVGVGALVRSRGLPSLRRLCLGNNRLGDAGARRLARWSGLDSLTNLGLDDNGIGNAGAQALVESPYGREIDRIGFHGNSLVTIALPEVFRR